MPFARLTVFPVLPEARATALARRLGELIASVLRKRPDLTSVLIDSPNAGAWLIGGADRQPAAHLEVTVTAGTNSPQEKAEFVHEAMRLLRDSLPGLHAATYVVVREVAANDWGYDGQTQAQRAAGGAITAVSPAYRSATDPATNSTPAPAAQA